MFLSVVIPAFNEAAKIEEDVRRWLSYFEEFRYDAELLIVDDGSTDDSQGRLKNLTGSRVRSFGYSQNRGKGYAVKYGIARAVGRYVAFADAGGCVPPICLEKGLLLLTDGWDFAIGSRRTEGARVARAQSWYRRAGSTVFRRLMEAWLEVRVSDSQCVFKVYRRDAASAIFSQVVTDGFMFDIEALLGAQAQGLRGAEFPVEWRADSDSRYRPILGSIANFKELVAIKLRTQWITGSR